MKFGCCLRTIEPLWKDRAAYQDDEALPEVTIDEAIAYLTEPDHKADKGIPASL
jgi:hypothetical protein